MQASIPGTTVAIATPDLKIIDGQITTTSLQVAEHFGKRHDTVLRAIRNLLEEMPEDYRRNFAEVTIEFTNGKGGTQQAPAYRMTRDGFTLLAMGFTGKEALQWKLAYLSAFNHMEAQLLAQATPYSVQPRQTISAEQAQFLRSMLTDYVGQLPQKEQAKFMREAWSKLKSHFKVPYRQIPAQEFYEATSLLARHIGGYIREFLPREVEPTPKPIPDTLTAFEAAVKAGAAVQAQVFEALLQNTTPSGRYELNIETRNQPRADLKPISPQAYAMEVPDLIQMIEREECLIPTAQLLALSHACNSRAHRRLHGSGGCSTRLAGTR